MTATTEFWTHFSTIDPREAGAHARRLEDEGWDGAVMYDSQSMMPDIWPFLAAASSATSRITLASGTTNLVTRHPSVTAAAAIAIQMLSRGRMVLGVGRGDSALAFIGASPMRIAAFEHYLEVLRAYLRGEEVDLEVASAMLVGADAGYTTLGIASEPRSSSLMWLNYFDVAPVPIEVMATGPRTIRAGARVADRVVLGLSGEVNRVAWGAEIARTAAAEAGREVAVGAVVVIVPHEDVSVARELARVGAVTTARYSVMNGKVIGPATPKQRETLLRIAEVYDMNLHGGDGSPQSEVVDDEFIEQFAIVGDVDTCVQRIQEFVDLGLDRVTLSLGSAGAYAHSYDLLINEVLPRVRRA